tara:strand:- start:3116 stop:3685 length:570 start_codon:yes stop_codon:yes gene_type:complete
VNNKNENISDIELSLISAISGLDNKLEELDHNISLLSNQTQNSTDNLESDKELNKRISILEQKISKLDAKINKQPSTEISNQYLKTLPTKGRFSSKKKGYVLAESLRLKRIESIEKSLNTLLEKYGEAKISSENSDEVPMKINSQSNHSEVLSSDEFYLRSRGIFFGFLFSILLVLLLIVVSTGINIFI